MAWPGKLDAARRRDLAVVAARRVECVRVVRRQPLSAWFWAVVAMLLYSLLAVMQWRAFASPSFDHGIFMQAVKGYAQFQAPIVNIRGVGLHHLGDHFHPLVAVLAPLWWVAPSGLTLLMAQAALLAVSVFFVTMTADEQLDREAGWLVGGAYALAWGVQQAARVQFHEVALAAPILAIGLWCMVRERWTASACWLGLLVFVKEDLGLTLAILGLVVALRSKKWRLGMGLAAWGIAWLLIAVKLVLPRLNNQERYGYTDMMPFEQILGHPVDAFLEIFRNDQKVATLTMLALCTGLLFLRSNIALALLPTLSWRMLSGHVGHWGPTWHYSLVLMPIAFIAAVDGMRALRGSRYGFLRRYVDVAPAMMMVFAVTILNQQPLWALVQADNWKTGARQQAARAAVQVVPAGASVACDSSLMNWLIPTHEVYYVTRPENPVTDYVVVDMVAGGWSGKIEASAHAARLYPGTQWRTVFKDEGYEVAERVR